MFNFYPMGRLLAHPDELDWVTRSYFYRLAFLRGDLGHRLWLGVDSLNHPHVADFLIGLGLHLSGQPVPEVPDGDWSWRGQPYPDGARLRAARLPSTLMGSTIAPMVLAIGVLASGRPVVGITAGLLYAMNPLAAVVQSRAMSDGPLIFFSTLALLLFVRAMRHREDVGETDRDVSGRRWTFLLAGPPVLGLAVGSKLTGLIIVATVGVTTSLIVARHLVRRDGLASARWATWGLAVLALTVAWSIAVNPSLHREPVHFFRSMLEYRWVTAQEQCQIFPDAALHGPRDKAAALADRLLRRHPEIPHPAFSALHAALALLGLAALTVREVSGLVGRRGPTPALVLLVQSFILLFVVTPTLPLNWARYYLPYLPCWELATGFGLAAAVDGARAAGRAASSAFGGPRPDRSARPARFSPRRAHIEDYQ